MGSIGRWFGVFSLVALAACSGGGGDAAGVGTNGQAPASDVILVGEYGSMTGPEATFGQSTHNGVVLAIDEINAAGGVSGKKLELKSYDDQGKSQEASTAVTRLTTDDKVVAVIGEVASSLSMAGGRVAQKYQVPMISPSSTNEQVTKIGDMISRVCFVDGFQGYVVAKFAHDDLKATKIAVLYDQGQSYSKGLKEEFNKAFAGMGGTIVTEQAYTSGDSDFGAQLGSIREVAPDAIFVPGYYTDVGNIALQAKKLGITAPLLGGDGWDSAQLAVIGGEAIEGSYYSNHYSHEEDRAEVKAFLAAYQKQFGAVPDGLAALGYDATKLLADAMKRSPSLAGPDLAKAIAQTKDFPGVTGKISMDENRDARKPAVILKMKGGMPTYVTTIYPPGMEAPAPAPVEAPPAAPVEPAAPAPAHP